MTSLLDWQLLPVSATLAPIHEPNLTTSRARIYQVLTLSTRLYARIVDEWVITIGIAKFEYGTRSLRRTKDSLIYKATGNLRAVQILLGYSNTENTVRFLVSMSTILSPCLRGQISDFRSASSLRKGRLSTNE
jgi:hypothetical protein